MRAIKSIHQIQSSLGKGTEDEENFSQIYLGNSVFQKILSSY